MNNKSPGVRSQKGIALIIAIFAMGLMVFIAEEISRDATVDYVVSSQQVNRVKAYYAAKAGVEISLLRLNVFKQAVQALGPQSAPMLAPIWQFPFQWPPLAVGTEVDKSALADAAEASLMQDQYVTSIQSEGGRLNINDLGSPLKGLREATRNLVLKIFESEVEGNEDFKKKYGNERFEELVNNISDWIDEDKESQNGGDESRPYENLKNSEEFPPNRAFRTVEELHMVAGMKDDFFRLLEPRVTVFGTMGISVNSASAEILKSLDASMTDEVVRELIRMRNDPLHGPFRSADQFLSEAERLGARRSNIEALKIPLLTGVEYNFRIQSTGVVNNQVKREITAITFDFDNLAQDLGKGLDEEWRRKMGIPPPPADNNQDKSKFKGPKGRPAVVYWEEN